MRLPSRRAEIFERGPVMASFSTPLSGRVGTMPAPVAALPPKFRVGPADGPLEQEADRLAGGIMKQRVGHVDRPSTTGQLADEATLSDSAQAFFQPRLGQDLSRVRIHTNRVAAESARSIGARAFTVGSHIFFGANEYRPWNRDGQQLLAHELAHTVQPGAGVALGRRSPRAGPGPHQYQHQHQHQHQRRRRRRRSAAVKGISLSIRTGR